MYLEAHKHVHTQFYKSLKGTKRRTILDVALYVAHGICLARVFSKVVLNLICLVGLEDVLCAHKRGQKNPHFSHIHLIGGEERKKYYFIWETTAFSTASKNVFPQLRKILTAALKSDIWTCIKKVSLLICQQKRGLKKKGILFFKPQWCIIDYVA